MTKFVDQPDWVKDFMKYNDIPIPQGSRVGTRFASGLLDLMRERKYTEINELMLLPNEKSTKFILVFFLRTTFSLRDKYPNWYVLRDNAIGWLEARNENYKSILHGLDKHVESKITRM